MKFADLKIEAESREEVFERIGQFINSGGYHYQISLNAAKAVYAQEDLQLKQAINEADIVTADGMPIKWISSIKAKHSNIARMGGLDFMDGLAERHPKWRYYFLGAKPEVLEKVVEHYRTKYGLNIVGSQHGYFDKQKSEAVYESIKELEVDVLYIAFGTPAKEYLLHSWKLQKKDFCKFGVGVGGAFNIISGHQKRAPEWMQNIGMEWFYRFAQEPRRMWKRYLVTNTLFMILILKEILGISKND